MFTSLSRTRYAIVVVGRVLVRMYDYSLAPMTHVLAQYVFGLGAVLYGGNFAVRDTSRICCAISMYTRRGATGG